MLKLTLWHQPFLKTYISHMHSKTVWGCDRYAKQKKPPTFKKISMYLCTSLKKTRTAAKPVLSGCKLKRSGSGNRNIRVTAWILSTSRQDKMSTDTQGTRDFWNMNACGQCLLTQLVRESSLCVLKKLQEVTRWHHGKICIFVHSLWSVAYQTVLYEEWSFQSEFIRREW